MRIYRQCLVFLGLNEKFAVQIRSNVVDKNHMEEKNSNLTSVCTLTLLVQQSIPLLYRFIKYIKAVLVRKYQLGFVTRTFIRG